MPRQDGRKTNRQADLHRPARQKVTKWSIHHCAVNAGVCHSGRIEDVPVLTYIPRAWTDPASRYARFQFRNYFWGKGTRFCLLTREKLRAKQAMFSEGRRSVNHVNTSDQQ